MRPRVPGHVRRTGLLRDGRYLCVADHRDDGGVVRGWRTDNWTVAWEVRKSVTGMYSTSDGSLAGLDENGTLTVLRASDGTQVHPAGIDGGHVWSGRGNVGLRIQDQRTDPGRRG